MSKKTTFYLFLFISILITVSFLSCDRILDILFDTEPPTANIVSPENGLEVSIDTGYIKIIIHAEDDIRVRTIDIYLDSVLIATVSNWDEESDTLITEFEYDLNIATYANCLPHLIYAIANDNGLNATATLPIYITINQDYYAETIPKVTEIKPTTALTKGSVSCDNYSHVTERGICWSHSKDPLNTDSHVSSGSGLGSFSCIVTELDPNSSYYFRAYAVNDLNTFYGKNIKFITPPIEIPEYDMVDVKGGFFSMGDVFDTTYSDGLPIHKVYLTKYQIGKFEVTQDLYTWIMEENPCTVLGGRLPVYEISWIEAVEFCNALSEIKGYDPVYSIGSSEISCNFNKNGYRLPTEAEWEYAARSSGKDIYKWSGTSSSTLLDDYAWINTDTVKTVGTKLSNELGLYDMTGNVLEWCWGVKDNYTEGLKLNPRKNTYSRSSKMVARGGNIRSSYSLCHNAWRWRAFSFGTYDNFPVGFRLVKKAE